MKRQLRAERGIRPLGMFLRILAITVGVEVLVMVVLPFLDITHDMRESVIAAVTVPLLSTPLIYVGVVRDGGWRLRGLTVDATERKRAEESLRDISEKMKTLIESMPDAVYLKNGQGQWELVNSAGLRLFELEDLPYQGKTEAELAELRPRYRDALLTCTHTDEEAWEHKGVSVNEEVIPKPEGSPVVIETIKVPLFNGDGSRKGLVVVGRDITERKRFEALLAHLADRDPLTGLFNRRRFQEELERELSKARRYGVRGAVMFLDLDDFKGVNGSFGDQEGDELLKSLAGFLRKRLRETDILGRLGGDEFAILLPHTGARQAREAAERILEAVSRHVFLVGGKSIGITVSIGVTLYPEQGTTARELLAHADVAMYRVKEDGGNGFWVYAPDAGEGAVMQSRLSWERRIRDALDKDLFVLHCQPILDLRSNRVSHYELLLRMVGDGGEVVPPGSFLDVAERFGLIHFIDRWVVRRAIRIIAEQHKVGQDLCFTVNLSGKAFEDRELPAMIRRELAENAIDPAHLVLEITETAAVGNIDQAREFVEMLQGVGCHFALDDFGVGFSSFYNLKHLPVDYIKIDGSFIRDLPRNAVDQHVVKAMVQVARGMEKRTVAEFVSDEETVQLLREYGVDYAQGYHIGRPRAMCGEVPNVIATTEREG